MNSVVSQRSNIKYGARVRRCLNENLLLTSNSVFCSNQINSVWSSTSKRKMWNLQWYCGTQLLSTRRHLLCKTCPLPNHGIMTLHNNSLYLKLLVSILHVHVNTQKFQHYFEFSESLFLRQVFKNHLCHLPCPHFRILKDTYSYWCYSCGEFKIMNSPFSWIKNRSTTSRGISHPVLTWMAWKQRREATRLDLFLFVASTSDAAEGKLWEVDFVWLVNRKHLFCGIEG